MDNYLEFYDLVVDAFPDGGSSGPLKEASKEEIKNVKNGVRIEYVATLSAGYVSSGPPLEVHIKDGRIIRCLPFHLPEDFRTWEIKTDRGTFKIESKKRVPELLWLAYKKRVYSPSRVKYPLKRVDWSPDNPNPQNRGKSGFVRISWEEAIDIVVDMIKRIKEKYGNLEPVLVQAEGHGQPGFTHCCHYYGGYLFDKLDMGWTHQVRNPDSWEGYYWGAKLAWGFDPTVGEPYQDGVWDNVLQYTELAIFTGCDPETTSPGFGGQIQSHFIRFLKKAGIKIVAIAPDANYTTVIHADKWIPINPNTDAALYLAIAYVWITEDLYDKEYVEKYCVGFEEFKKHVLGEDDGIPKTPEWAEKITGIPQWTIKALARAWAKKRTSIAVHFGGPKVRGKMSHLPARLEAYCLAMQGLGKPGRTFFRFYFSTIGLGRGFLISHVPALPRYLDVEIGGRLTHPAVGYAIVPPPPKGIPLIKTLISDAILNPPIKWWCCGAQVNATEDLFEKYRYPPTDDHPGIRMIWNENGCYTTCWHGYKFIEALRSPKIEFHVVIHPWLENDALFADLVLPALTDFEVADVLSISRMDIVAVGYHDKCVDPIGESKSDYEIHKMIAERLAKEFNKPELLEAFPDPEEFARNAYEGSLAYKKYKISWEELKKRKVFIYPCPTWEEWAEIKKQNDFEVYGDFFTWFYKRGSGLETPSKKFEFVSNYALEYAPDDPERPPVAKWVEHDELPTSPKAEKYPFLVVANHPRYRFHAQGDDNMWLRELYKVRGPDGYLYEPVWIHPSDAEKLGVKTGDVVMIYNDIGSILAGVVVTERIKPGAVLIEHGSRVDLISIEDRLDRGGAVDLIAPSSAEKYKPGEEIRIPEQICSGFHVAIKKVDVNELMKKYPEMQKKHMHPITGPTLETYLVEKAE